MEATHNQTSSFENYPFLTAEEFAEACHHLDRRYCQATLGPVRRQWKLRANTALLMAFTPLAEYSTYVQIIRPLDGELDDEGLSAQLDKLSFDAPGIGEPTSTVDADEHMVDEENDTVWQSSNLAYCCGSRLYAVRSPQASSEARTLWLCYL